MWIEGTVSQTPGSERAATSGIFLTSAGATLTISVPNPLVAWAYAFAVLTGACWWTIYTARAPTSKLDSEALPAAGEPLPWRSVQREIALLAIAAWGALQWTSGHTVYRYATLDEWTHVTALAAVAFLARDALRNARLRYSFLSAFAWFSGAVAGVAVLAYFTSPARILWLFPSPYPDTWGPFLSRNDFAAFLELAFPVALSLALGNPRTPSTRHPATAAPMVPQVPGVLKCVNRVHPAGRFSRGSSVRPAYLCLAAGLLAAGVASASRAGSALLAAEAIVILVRRAPCATALKFAAATAALIGVVGAGTLLGRWREPDAWRYRREIDRSAIAMIADRPLAGFGLGTFARAYPAYAYFDPGATVDHAHNDWLEWGAEGGVLYALAWCLIAVSVARPAARSIWGLGVIAVFLHACVDYSFARFGVSAWTMALIGILSADEMREVSVWPH